jgi:hypothetical protein|tara:strand:- start:1858 stop:2349 length:492 start_codon:yes stop_codon:yes gene_type:complete
MPLILPTLQGDLINIFEKGPTGNPTPSLVGIKTGQAYLTYCSTIMNMGGGSFSGMPGSSALGSELGNILSATSPSSALTAQKIARAFNDCLSTLLTVFQTTIVTAPGFGSLVPELIDLLSTPKPSATLFATKFATALNNFTSAAVISGVVPGTPPVPFTGPPS